MKWFAQCCDGEIRPLGEHEDFDGADGAAMKLGHEIVWIHDHNSVLDLYANIRHALWANMNWEHHP